ncbi:response regulator [Kribbella sp. NPDC055071]
MIRVAVADDHPLVRDGLRWLLEATEGIELVAEAANGHEAIRCAVVDHPDVLVMDLHMPDLDGVAATAEIARTAPSVAVLVLTMLDDDESVFAAMRAGARGYLVKGAGQQEIVRALTAVAAGEAIFGPGVAQRVWHYFANPPTPAPPFPELTPREREVLEMMAAGSLNASIAGRLGLTTKTINNHISAIFTKLQVAGRPEAIARARDAGLGRDS